VKKKLPPPRAVVVDSPFARTFGRLAVAGAAAAAEVDTDGDLKLARELQARYDFEMASELQKKQAKRAKKSPFSGPMMDSDDHHDDTLDKIIKDILAEDDDDHNEAAKKKKK
jgi:hypothetical protein